MDYTFQATGTITFFGFPVIKVRKLYPSKFTEGEIAYVLRKARLGFYEKIAIKKVVLNFKFGQPIFLYKDTFNTLYNEKDLCRFTEAQQEVESYRDYLSNLVFKGYLDNPDVCSFGPSKTSLTIKKIINKVRGNNFGTKYFDAEINSEELIRELDNVLLDGGTP